MMSLPKSLLLLAAMAVTVGHGGVLSARPVNWSVPMYHFDYVNNQGELSIWMRLAEIDVGDGLTLPIQVNFTPSRGYSTPTLDAAGWMIGLVDAPAFQLDERRFLIYTPAGRYKVFRRQADDPNKLRGYPNWEGEVRGSTIDVRSTTDRLIYRHGRLVEMHLGDRRFELSRSGGVLREIREGGRVVLAVRPNARGDQLELDMGGGQSIWLKFGQRPMVQTVRGERMVAEMARSLDEIRLPDGEVIAFDYAVDADLRPTMRVNEGPGLAWQPATGHMHRAGEWTYEVEPDEWRFYHAAIRRTNTEGQEEFWHRDRRRGMEATIWADGRKEVREWFVSGPAKGKLRSVAILNPASEAWSDQVTIAYDENGDRAWKREGLFTHVYERGGKLSAVKMGDALVQRYDYDSSGRLAGSDAKQGIATRIYRQDTDTYKTASYQSDGRIIWTLYDSENNPINFWYEEGDLDTSDEN